MGHIIRVLCPVNLHALDRILWLIGAPSLPLTILSAVRCLHYDDASSTPEIREEADDLQVLIPRGLEILGAIVVSDDHRAETCKIAGQYAHKMRSALGQSSPKGTAVVAATAITGRAEVEYNIFTPGDSPKLEVLEVVLDREDARSTLWADLSLLRCRMDLTIPLLVPNFSSLSVPDLEKQLDETVDHIMEDLKSSRVVLLAKGSSAKSTRHGIVLIQPFSQLKGHETVEAVTRASTEDTVQQSSPCSELCLPPSFFTTASGMQLPEPVELTLMLQQSGITNGKVMAPVVQFFPASEIGVIANMLKLSMAVVCMGANSAPLVDAVSDLVLPALRNQLVAMHKAATEDAPVSAKVCAYQFCPPGWLHPVTTIYDLSKGELELGLVERRRQLHRRLGLPLDRPMLRAANSVTFRSSDVVVSPAGGKLLKDVHVGLPRSGVSGGRQSLLDGSYEYYHYLQDRFDDNGWGCAYRSLQTIVSWFRLQQYTTVPVPSHRDVQQTLVDIEDKGPLFVGSQEWIGAVELSFVLDKLLGVSCKILNVRSGADMPSYCRELALHFETQGTPVMIGGGVLAYTLLGVDYNNLTGESAFLILDPHYTGGEDLRTIRNGGWCGWKRAVTDSGRPFFLHNKFYNLLLPQRPDTV